MALFQALGFITERVIWGHGQLQAIFKLPRAYQKRIIIVDVLLLLWCYITLQSTLTANVILQET